MRTNENLVGGHPPTGRTRLADHLPDSLTVVFGWPLTVSGRDVTSGHGASVSALGGLAASALSAFRHACHLRSCELTRPQTGAGRMVRTRMCICVHPAVEEAVVGGGAA